MEDGVRVLNSVNSWLSVGLLLDVNVNSWVLNDEWNFLADGVLFNFIDSKISDVSDFIWHLDLSGVVLPEFDNIWLINGYSEEGLVPFGHGELMFFVVWLLLVLSHWNLLRGDEWDLLDDGVVNSLGNFIGDIEVVLIWDLVVDCVWYFLSDNIWDLVCDSVGHFSAGGVWDLEFDLEWHLSLNSVGHFSCDFIWLKGLNIVVLSHEVGSGDLVWDRVDIDYWDLLGDLVFFSHVFGDIVVVGVIG